MKSSISVIIPVYNRREALVKAIDSVVGQTLLPDEIIVVDDCSPFSIEDFLKEQGYLEKYPVKVIRNKVNQGPAGSRNNGIINAGGEYIAFLDSDDYWDKDKLNKQMQVFHRDPALDLVYCDMWIANGEKITPSGKKLYTTGLWDHLVTGWWTPTNPSTMLMKKTSLEKLNLFDTKLWGTEDLDLWMRIAQQNMKVDYCPECLSYFTFDSNDRITKHKDKLKRAKAFLSKWEQYFSQTGDKKNLVKFRNNSSTKFAIESFVDAVRDRNLWVPIKVYFEYLWNKKAFYELILGKFLKS